MDYVVWVIICIAEQSREIMIMVSIHPSACQSVLPSVHPYISTLNFLSGNSRYKGLALGFAAKSKEKSLSHWERDMEGHWERDMLDN